MNLDVSILENSININATVNTNDSNFTFKLSKTLEIKTDYHYITKEVHSDFQPDMIEYTFYDVPNTFSFSYAGKQKGWFCFFEKDLIHFSFYNAWYPMTSNIDDEYDIFIHGFKDWTCVQGVYDETNDGWIHKGSKISDITDCNIILVKNDCWDIYSSNGLKVYSCYKDNEHIKQLPNAFTQIAKFYAELYKEAIKDEFSIFFLPDRKQGAYIRHNLIVYGYCPDDTIKAIHLLAHELGHNYASMACTTTFEDWLNETNAEWSALSFMYEYDRNHFDQCVEKRLENEDIKLNPFNNKRPQNVHETGPSIYARIYKQYGIDTIHTILQTHLNLPIKDTATFLKAQPENISSFIKQYL